MSYSLKPTVSRCRYGTFERLPAVKLRSRIGLFASVSSLAMVFVSVGIHQARANEECGSGTTVVCSATDNPYENGITYSYPGDLNLSFESGVAVSTTNAVGVGVDNSSGAVSIDTSAGTIATTGAEAAGINIYSPNNGAVTIVTADVSTTGDHSEGIALNTRGEVEIDTTAGKISTTGNNASAVSVATGAQTTIVTGDISTSGKFSSGIGVFGGRYDGGNGQYIPAAGRIAIDTTAGAIHTSGNSSDGVLVSSVLTDVVVTAGQVTAAGASAFGVGVASEGAVGQSTVVNVVGPIVSAGRDGGGVVVRDAGEGGDIQVNAHANITAAGQNAVGIAAGSLNGAVNVTVDSGVAIMGGWSANPNDLSGGPATQIDTQDYRYDWSHGLGGGLPAAGVVLFSGSTADSPAAYLVNNGTIGAMNDRAVTMGYPCANRTYTSRGGTSGSGGGSGGLLYLKGPESFLDRFASAVFNALIPSAHAAAPPTDRGCADGDAANNLPPTQPVTIDNNGAMTGYVTLWDGAAHTFNNAGTFDVRNFADTDGDGVRDTKAVSVSDFGGPNATFNNQTGGIVRFAPVTNAPKTDATGYYVPTNGIDSRGLESSYYDLGREGVAQGQFVNLQTFNNSGTIDLRGPTTGNTLVMTSNPTAGGDPGTATFVTNGGQLLVNTVINDGIAPGGASNSYSDMLIVERTRMGAAPTSIGISYDPAVAGALTPGNGIEIVEVRDKANSAPGVFTQGNRVAGSAYEYRLYHNGVGGDAADGNWYLRSTRIPTTPMAPISPAAPGNPPQNPPPAELQMPDYRVEVPTDMVVPALASRLGLTMLGTYDDRLGATYADPAAPAQPLQDIWCKDASRNFRCRPTAQQNAYYEGAGAGSEPSRPRFWGRVFGEFGSYGAGGRGEFGRLHAFESRGPSYDARLGGLQFGADLYRDSFNTAGLYAGYGRTNSDVDAVYGGRAGSASMDGYSIGGYWTHRRPGGWYFDTVMQGTYYGSIDARSVLGERLRTDGWGFAASLETGYPITLGAGWTVTPQAQAIYQYLDIDGGADRFGRIAYGDSSSVYGRVGAKLNKDWAAADGRTISTWVRVNYWHSFGAEAKTTFTNLAGAYPVTLDTQLGGDWMQFGLGVSGQLTRNVTAFASADYNLAVASGSGRSLGGRVGLQVRW